jgi:hypothetical protein
MLLIKQASTSLRTNIITVESQNGTEQPYYNINQCIIICKERYTRNYHRLAL